MASLAPPAERQHPRVSRQAALGPLVSVPVFFGMRVASALLLLKVSAITLPMAGFSQLTQYLLFGALLNMIAVGGAQNGVVREVAASADEAGIARARMGGFMLWACAAALIGLPVMLLASPIADFLVGDTTTAWAVVAIALVIFLAGPGQIWCAILTGRGRVAASLSAQGTGLVVGTAGALVMLLHHDALWAAVAFAAGPLITALIAWTLVHRMVLPKGNPAEKWIEAKKLLGYSGAFIAVALFSSLTFFGLRYAYRDAFGLDVLAFWLVANRISDVNTQLLGLYMTQVFVPRYAASLDAPRRYRIVQHYWMIAAGVMALPIIVFALAPDLLVRLFLAERYLPAAGWILAYIIGDFLRVWGSMAMHAAFAEARLTRYVAIEVATVTLFATIALVLIALGDQRAPVIGYVAAYGISAMIVTIGFLRSRWRQSQTAT